MDLRDFQLKLISNRADQNLSEREFFGRLLDTAFRSIDHPAKFRSRSEYQKMLRNLYVAPTNRSLIPTAITRAILLQSAERFDDVVRFLEVSLLHHEQIVQNILQSDGVCDSQIDIFQLIEQQHLEKKASVRVFSAFLTEYFYHVLAKDLINFTIPELDAAKHCIDFSFPYTPEFSTHLLKFFSLSAEERMKNNVQESFWLVCQEQLIMCIEPFVNFEIADEMGNDAEDFYVYDPTRNQVDIRWPTTCEFDIKSALLLKNYAFFMTDNTICIYIGQAPLLSFLPVAIPVWKEDVYRVIRLPRFKSKETVKFLAMHFVPGENNDEKTGELIAMTNCYLMRIKIDRIGWETSDFTNRSGKVDDFDLFAFLPIEDSHLCGMPVFTDGKVSYALCEGGEIHKITLTFDFDCSEHPLLREDKKIFDINPIFNHVQVSPNGCIAFLGVKNDNKFKQCILQKCDGGTLKLLGNSAVKIDGCVFSNDSRFFGYTIYDDTQNISESFVADIVNMRIEKIPSQSTAPCKFIGFLKGKVALMSSDGRQVFELNLHEIFSTGEQEASKRSSETGYYRVDDK